MRFGATLFVTLFAFFCLAAAPADMIGEKTTAQATDAVTPDAVWNADKQTVQEAKQRCVDAGGKELEECFAEAMQSFGASPEAVAFTRSFGGGTFVRRFRETGRVDVVHVIYPFRANENNGLLLVNGDPPIVDVDDIALLPKEAMEQESKTYSAIKKSYPKVALWPGDRSLKQPPVVETLPGEGSLLSFPIRSATSAIPVRFSGRLFLPLISIKEAD